MNSLDEIAQQIRTCRECPLYQGTTNPVPGEGPPAAQLMLIGEAPGYHEDRQGRPFVGPAGKFLEELLESIGLNRRQVYITNMVKHRPPQNREPLPSEIAACSKFLDRQIELVNPRLIVTLGRFSLTKFFPGENISRARGRVRERDGRLIYPVMHPAAALHRQELRATIIRDFQAIPRLLQDTNRASSAATTLTQEEVPSPKQLSLL